jgi:hypothetical protein
VYGNHLPVLNQLEKPKNSAIFKDVVSDFCLAAATTWCTEPSKPGNELFCAWQGEWA